MGDERCFHALRVQSDSQLVNTWGAVRPFSLADRAVRDGYKRLQGTVDKGK